jgi:hypothetical protein
MTKRLLALLLTISLLLTYMAVSAGSSCLSALQFPALIRPGKAELISFYSSREDSGALLLLDRNGREMFVIHQNLIIHEGGNALVWNGLDPDMTPVPEGQYLLKLQISDDSVQQPLQIGAISPQITQLKLGDSRLLPGEEWTMDVQVNMPGTLAVVFHVAQQLYEVFHGKVDQGITQISWDGMMGGETPPAGHHTLSVVFMDETGFAANQQHITLEVVRESESITDGSLEAYEELPMTPDGEGERPNRQTPGLHDEEQAEQAPPAAETQAGNIREGYHYAVPTKEEVPEADYGKDFWRLPVGDYNEEAIWKVMMQPITVVWGKAQTDVYRIRATPDASTKRENIVGEIHHESQGVHVIEQREDGWSLVEVYNSSYGPDNRTRRGYGNTDELICGYVRTSDLRVIEPRSDYGILIDKLKQRLYVFKEGKIFTELLISTGNPTRQQPWNETPSGEFLMVSRTGNFNAGNLVCRMSMRINGGALIHEVPYIVNESTGYWDYSSQEAQLGKKASHGCIRVQRLNNNDGINMTWLWNNIKVNTKVLVWDDDNRYYEYPDSDLPLFFNPNGGRFYHLDQNCRSIKDRYLPLEGTLVYRDLDNSEYAKLTPCPHCNPPLRASQIDQINKDNGF